MPPGGRRGSIAGIVPCSTRGDLAWQTAIGVVLDEPPPGPLGTPTVMDFTDPGSTDDICVPTFVYAFPVADGWLVEETVLAGPALEPDRLLPRLASRLAESPAHLMERAIRVERVRIPMGAPVPSRPGRGDATQTATESGAAAGTTTGTVRFGAAAGMIHPATGYSVASSLRAAGRVADAVIERLGRPVDRTADAAAVVDAVWPRSLRRTRRLHDFGLEVLVGMDAAEIRGLLPDVLRVADGSMGVVSAHRHTAARTRTGHECDVRSGRMVAAASARHGESAVAVRRAPALTASDRRTASTQPTTTQIAKMNHWIAYDRWGPLSSSGSTTGEGSPATDLGLGR